MEQFVEIHGTVPFGELPLSAERGGRGGKSPGAPCDAPGSPTRSIGLRGSLLGLVADCLRFAAQVHGFGLLAVDLAGFVAEALALFGGGSVLVQVGLDDDVLP
ncbi:hypothetical protein [Qipengyuania citrea]|uniref:hypothetical protein n=1 Tax=Qipengyuania citrea TaxID=225971 RepID=UPI00067F29A7|nr:hypothetical protein [Qipengyuania citrea]